MKLKDLEIEFPVVTVGAFGTDPVARTVAAVVPIMSNAVAVKKGEELCLESTPKKEAKRKEGPWKDDVAKAAKAPKANATAKTAPSLELPTEI